MGELTVNDMIEAYTLDAIDFAKANFDIDLDRSESSVKSIEEIASRLYATIPQSTLGRLFRRGPSQEKVDLACKMLGGYVGEVLRAQFGGEWSFNREIQPGNLVIELKIGETQIFPPAKVHKRLTNGDEDNLWAYFRVMQDRLSKKGGT